MKTSPCTSGSVMVTYNDGKGVKYDDITNVSMGKDWVFLKFSSGDRVQIPNSQIREMYEQSSVYVTGSVGERGK